VDADRHDYLRRYFAIEWRDEMLYDLQINTGNISIEDAAGLIAQAVALQPVDGKTVAGSR
jgi:cytidylate kinase